ncbi:MAG: beta strand repeat-containing protein, partial [Acetobacteraceae bacterium]
ILTGSAAGAVLLAGTNAIANLRDFSAGNDFELTNELPDGETFTLEGPVTLTASGGTIELKTDSLVEGSYMEAQAGVVLGGPLTDSWGALTAPGGEILIEPFTPGVPVALVGDGTQPPGTLSLNDGFLEVISANTLALTSFSNEPITISDSNVLGGLTNPHTGDASGVDALAVAAGGAFSELPGAALDVGALTGSAGSVALDRGNDIPVLGSFSTAGDFALVDSSPLTITAPVTVPNGHTITLKTDSVTVGSQTITENDGSATIGGALLAPGGGVSLEPFTSTVPVALVGAGVSQAGTLSINNDLLDVISANTLALTSFGNEPITISGRNVLGGLTNPHTGDASGVDALAVAAGGALSELPGASLDVGALSGGAASVTLAGANDVPTLGSFTSENGLLLDDATSLAVLGAVTDPIGITLAVNPGSLVIGVAGTPGALASSGTVNLQVPAGTITEPNGAVTAGTLIGTAKNLAVFGAGSKIASLGSFSVTDAGSELSLTDGVPLAITGPVSAGTLFVADTGAITEEPAGVLEVGTLTGNAGSATFGSANRISSLEEFAAAGSLSLTDATSLAVLGSVTAPSGIALVVLPGSLTLGGAQVRGVLDSADSVNLVVPQGSIAAPNGSIETDTLSGQASGLAAFGTAKVRTLDAFAVSGAAGKFSLDDSVPLVIAGPLSAAYLDISATGELTLAGALTTLGLPLADQSGAAPALPGSVLIVTKSAAGTARFLEPGASSIVPFGGGTATLRIQLPATNGVASFANLVGSNANLVLALGAGRASGTMTIGRLLVIGAGGGAVLTGSVAGVSGTRAASIAMIDPAINANYLFNNCVIGTVCTAFVLPVALPPPGSPPLLSGGGASATTALLLGGPLAEASAAAQFIVFAPLTITEVEDWSDSAGFPLPNVGREIY